MNYCAGYIRQQENQQLGIPRDVARTLLAPAARAVGYGVYNGLIGHIDKQLPADVILGPPPEAGGSDSRLQPHGLGPGLTRRRRTAPDGPLHSARELLGRIDGGCAGNIAQKIWVRVWRPRNPAPRLRTGRRPRP